MSNAQGKPMAIVCAAALALAMMSSQADVRAAAAAQQQRWNRFSADVTIRRGLRDTSHQPIGSDFPPASYRWRRAYSGGHWKTTMDVVGATRPEVVTTSGQLQAIPPAVARVEDDGEGQGPRFYSPQGVLLKPPTTGDRQRLGAPEAMFVRTEAMMGDSTRPAVANDGDTWVESVVPSLSRRSARRSLLQRRFGRMVEQTRGLDRYVETVGDATTEVLTHADWVVPIEVNVVRGGVLESHASFTYDAGPGGVLVRRRAHAEHTLARGKGARMMFDVELANVKLEDRR